MNLQRQSEVNSISNLLFTSTAILIKPWKAHSWLLSLWAGPTANPIIETFAGFSGTKSGRLRRNERWLEARLEQERLEGSGRRRTMLSSLQVGNLCRQCGDLAIASELNKDPPPLSATPKQSSQSVKSYSSLELWKKLIILPSRIQLSRRNT